MRGIETPGELEQVGFSLHAGQRGAVTSPENLLDWEGATDGGFWPSKVIPRSLATSVSDSRRSMAKEGPGEA